MAKRQKARLTRRIKARKDGPKMQNANINLLTMFPTGDFEAEKPNARTTLICDETGGAGAKCEIDELPTAVSGLSEQEIKQLLQDSLCRPSLGLVSLSLFEGMEIYALVSSTKGQTITSCNSPRQKLKEPFTQRFFHAIFLLFYIIKKDKAVVQKTIGRGVVFGVDVLQRAWHGQHQQHDDVGEMSHRTIGCKNLPFLSKKFWSSIHTDSAVFGRKFEKVKGEM
ncbi:unnamed protein product [Caenorhabditis auriculariae]|uniref:Uncharacterized protein n=1 Tax=Caenorhabditis auriculariae TaxID=2777116 RepID=A0A8S1HHW7_9PELO|nr:unnamed protein product [Caenorhabditis auriculariae]